MSSSGMVHDLLEKTISLQEHIHLILQGILVQKIHGSDWKFDPKKFFDVFMSKFL